MLRAPRCGIFVRRTRRNGARRSQRTRPRRSLRRNDAGFGIPESRTPSMIDKRGPAFARLFEAVHEGVYIGTIGPESTSTLAVNPHLKLIFGYPSETPEGDVRPFDRDRFVDPQARVAPLRRPATRCPVWASLPRPRRADGTALW